MSNVCFYEYEIFKEDDLMSEAKGKTSMGMEQNVDTHGQSPWHFTGQASLDLNPGPPAISHTH